MEVHEVEHENMFEKVIEKGNVYLKYVGLKLNSEDVHRNFVNRLRFRKLFCVTFLSFHIDVCGQLKWLIGSFINGNSDFIDITFVVPCFTISLMGFLKSVYFLKNIHYIHEIIATLKKLKNKRLNITRRQEDEFEKRCVKFLYTADKIIKGFAILVLITFAGGPLLVMATTYYNTGETKLIFPFLFYYPFNAFDIRVFPILYAQQLWSASVTLCTIWGPDYICYAMTTFIIIQFYSLKLDIVNLFPKSEHRELVLANDMHRIKFREIINRHNDLLRCANLLEITYMQTVLFNVVFSSMIICCDVFNITANDNIVTKLPYMAFLSVVLGQIFLLCCFGDKLMRSSMEVSDAIYKCQWYKAEPALARNLIVVAMRANKPCKLTACGFSDVNLTTFTKILSTSWSYLALIQTVYNKNKAESKI